MQDGKKQNDARRGQEALGRVCIDAIERRFQILRPPQAREPPP
jgi:hypothetical protein